MMLTAESEGGHVKCHHYWVDGRYGPLALVKRSEKRILLERKDPNDPSMPHIIMRRFTLQHSHQPFSPVREIIQLQYASWPDFGTPVHPSHILALIEYKDAVMMSTGFQVPVNPSLPPSPPRTSVERPAIIHCSAGCGRTGVFCAVDTVCGTMLLRSSS